MLPVPVLHAEKWARHTNTEHCLIPSWESLNHFLSAKIIKINLIRKAPFKKQKFTRCFADMKALKTCISLPKWRFYSQTKNCLILFNMTLSKQEKISLVVKIFGQTCCWVWFGKPLGWQHSTATCHNNIKRHKPLEKKTKQLCYKSWLYVRRHNFWCI